MFRYKPIDMSRQSFYSSTHTEEVATIEELIQLCKEKKVDRVIIPQTYDFEGYGADLMSLSNSRSIKRDYKSRVKAYGHELSISAWQFLKHEEFQEMIEQLQEENPIYDEEDYTTLESETHEQYLVDELYYRLRNDDELPTELEWSEEKIREVLHSGSWLADDIAPLEWWDIVITDNDGLTPYMRTEDFDRFYVLFIERAKHLGIIKNENWAIPETFQIAWLDCNCDLRIPA